MVDGFTSQHEAVVCLLLSCACLRVCVRIVQQCVTHTLTTSLCVYSRHFCLRLDEERGGRVDRPGLSPTHTQVTTCPTHKPKHTNTHPLQQSLCCYDGENKQERVTEQVPEPAAEVFPSLHISPPPPRSPCLELVLHSVHGHTSWIAGSENGSESGRIGPSWMFCWL